MMRLELLKRILAVPTCSCREHQMEEFVRERIEPHPVYHLRMTAPSINLTSEQAGQMIRKMVEQAGGIPRGGFFCAADRHGRVEASFVLIL